MISRTYVPKTYADLLRCVRQTMFAGQREIDEAWVRTYHETGRLIHCHILLSKRADYGAQVFRGLARDTGASERTLYECAQFYRCFPILRTCAELNWGHYRLLCQVGDTADRAELLAEARRRGWTCAELASRVRVLNAANGAVEAGGEGSGTNGETAPAAVPPLLKPKRGTPGLYPVVARGDGFAFDLGFKMYLPFDSAPGGPPGGIRPGDIVRIHDDDTFVRAGDATKADLFTYRARDVRVVGGDTLAVTIALPPHHEIDKKLRLRGIDCAELDTDAGRAAKRFTQSLVAAAASIVFTTTKPDKYDRYLADVFLIPPDPGLETSEGVFLNNALLQNGHADRSDGSVPAGWVA